MGLRFKNQDLSECFFVTTSFYQHRRLGELDGAYKQLADSLAFCLRKYESRLPAYVFMPSHIHLLLVIGGPNLGPFMRDFKKFTAQKALRACGAEDSRIWQHRYDRVAVLSERTFLRKLEYIHRNPVRAGLVAQVEQWFWSSASDYLTE